MTKDTENNPKQLPINQETLDIIVANIIPTSKYFEVRFDNLEQRVDRIQENIKDFQADVDNRFDKSREEMNDRFDKSREEMNDRFDKSREEMNNRFIESREEMNNRFDKSREEMNNRFEQADRRLDEFKNDVAQRLDEAKKDVNQRFDQIVVSIDRLTDKLEHRDQDQRSFTMRMFSISILISFLGVLGVFLKIFKVV